MAEAQDENKNNNDDENTPLNDNLKGITDAQLRK